MTALPTATETVLWFNDSGRTKQYMFYDVSAGEFVFSKAITGAGGGGTDDLDDVCLRGHATTTDIETSSTIIHINTDGTDISYLKFHSTGVSLYRDSAKFGFTDDLYVDGYMQASGNVYSNGNVYANYGGVGTADAYIYFNTTLGGNEGASLMWDDSVPGFILSHTINMSGAKITNLGTPTATTDACTKAYADSVGGGSQTLDNVCDLGNTTDQDIKGQDLYCNYDQASGIANMYFLSGGQYIRYNTTGTVFQVSDELQVAGKISTTTGDIEATGDIYTKSTNIFVNSDGANADCYVYFYYTTAIGAYLKWDNPGFKFSHTLDMNSTKITSLATPTVGTDACTKAYADSVGSGGYFAGEDIYLNQDHSDSNVVIYFWDYDGAGNESIMWDATYHYFVVSDDVYISGSLVTTALGAGDIQCLGGSIMSAGDVYIHYGGADGGALYFRSAGSSTGASIQLIDGSPDFLMATGHWKVQNNIYLNYDSADTCELYFSSTNAYLRHSSSNYFLFSEELHVTGDIESSGDIYINTDEDTSVDCYLYFTAFNEYLKWAAAGLRFELSDDLYIAATTLSNGNLSTNGQLICDADNDNAAHRYVYFGTGNYIRWTATNGFELNDNLYITGSVFRIDQTATASGTLVASHYITINCNGTNYKVMLDV